MIGAFLWSPGGSEADFFTFSRGGSDYFVPEARLVVAIEAIGIDRIAQYILNRMVSKFCM